MPWQAGRFLRPWLRLATVWCWDGHQEVYFQTLLITEVIEFLAHSTVGLGLEYFCRDEPFEQNSRNVDRPSSVLRCRRLEPGSLAEDLELAMPIGRHRCRHIGTLCLFAA